MEIRASAVPRIVTFGDWKQADRCNLPKWLAAAPDLLGMTFACK